MNGVLSLDQATLDRKNAALADAAPVDLLRFAHATFGRRAAILSSMQKAGTALCRMAHEAGLDFDVVFVDTGLLHRETLATRDAVARAYPGLRIVTLEPERSFADQTRDEGLLYVTKEGQERCCDLRKSAPLRAVRGRYDAFVSALRRGEGGARARVAPLGLDPEENAVRIHPFHATSHEDLDRYVREHDVIVNPLHLMGFPTIGCFPCTTPVRPDEGERAGRWRHLAGVEYCGINPVDRGAAQATVTLSDAYRSAFS